MSSDGRPPSSRPRIRKAHSAEQEYSGPSGPDSTSAQHGGGGGVHWYGDDGVLYYRGDDGGEYYLASDGAYYPRGLLAEALSSSQNGSAAFGASVPFGSSGASASFGSSPSGASAADDRSTYYEYIARHSGEFPAHPGPGAGHPKSGAGHAQGSPHAGPHSALAEAPAGYPPAPPQPSAPPFATGPGSPLHAHQGTNGSSDPTGSPHPAAAGRGTGSGPASGAGAAAAPSGAPAAGDGRTRPRRRWVALVVGTVALLAVVALGITLGFVFLGPDRGVQATDIETPTADPTDRATGSTPEDSEGAPPPAEDQLNEHVADGTRIAHEQLEGQWVVQLSAKKDGLEANGRTWDDEAILEEFEENQRRHPDAVLLWSGDWSSFRLSDFWVTVLAEPYDDPADALATCRNLGLDRDNCFAKKLSTSEGPDGTTELND